MSATTTTKPRGIILDAREVRALRGDRLTLLVRPVNPQPPPHTTLVEYNTAAQGFVPWEWSNGGSYAGGRRTGEPIVGPFGAPGERRFVRETWAYFGGDEYLYQQCRGSVGYRADHVPLDPVPGGRWRSSSTMPAWAARDTIEVVSLAVRRVQSVTEDEARACGFDASIVLPGDQTSYVPAFGDEWTRKHGAESWDRNDWMWMIGVRRAEESERGAA